MKDSSGRLAKWRLRPTEFDFEVIHCPGKQHQDTDAMSRMPRNPLVTDTVAVDIDDDTPTYCVIEQVTEPIDETNHNVVEENQMPMTDKMMEAQA